MKSSNSLLTNNVTLNMEPMHQQGPTFCCWIQSISVDKCLLLSAKGSTPSTPTRSARSVIFNRTPGTVCKSSLKRRPPRQIATCLPPITSAPLSLRFQMVSRSVGGMVGSVTWVGGERWLCDVSKFRHQSAHSVLRRMIWRKMPRDIVLDFLSHNYIFQTTYCIVFAPSWSALYSNSRQPPNNTFPTLTWCVIQKNKI